MAGRGRDQRGPMERLVRIAAVLKAHGSEGVTATRLVEVAGFESEHALDQLAKELQHLRQQGWQIDNIAAPGAPARYRMVTVDNRFRVRLTPAQQHALQRAVLVADRADLVDRLGLPQDEKPADVSTRMALSGHDERLTTALRAVRHRCRMRFRYGGRQRVVHPESVKWQNERWYLRALEDGGDEVKAFVVERIGDVRLDPPGTAVAIPPAARLELHPMRWKVDPPVEVVVRTSKAYLPDVERWLGSPMHVDEDGEDLLLRYEVTNRAALRVRIYELGKRVHLLGPDDVRRELLDELSTVAGAG